MNRLVQRFPTLTASAIYTVAVAAAFWPFWLGRSLINGFSDQRYAYPFHVFLTQYLRQHHSFPQWTPYIFGGMPFAANPTVGDTFYPPTTLLRLTVSADKALNLGIMLHIVLAGVFLYLLLRAFKLEWGAAFVGGAAYMFTGMILSLVTAGHDGKIYVSALLPLGFLFLYRGVTRGDWRSYLGFGTVVGFSLLSPHVQLTYYELMADGFFWLFLVFFGKERPDTHAWWHAGLLFVGALCVGFSLDAIQLLPFMQNISYTGRAAAGSMSTGWQYATSYSMPPEEILNVIWPSFSGTSLTNTYWGRNFFKLHNEYFGVATLILASFAFLLAERRRIVWFLVFLFGFGALYAFGGHTPFYYLPYTLLPGIKLTRAPGMIFFLPAFATACLAGLGTQVVLKEHGGVIAGRILGWLGVLVAALVLAVAGGWKGVMLSFAPPQQAPAVNANYPVFMFDTIRAVLVAAIVLGLVAALRSGRLRSATWATLLGVLVLLDLWSAERRQIVFQPPAAEQFAPDGVVQALRGDSTVFRLLRPTGGGCYTDNYPMLYGIRGVLGYEGTELHHFDELMGGKCQWHNLPVLNLWRLLAVKYVVTEQPMTHAALTLIGNGPVQTYDSASAYVYRFEGYQPFARVVPVAFKAPDAQVGPTLLDPRFDPRRVLLVPPDAPVGVTSLSTMPDTVGIPVHTRQIRPGTYRFELAAPLERAAYLFVSENYYPAWRARVDGVPQPVVRAQLALMAVPLPAGSRVVDLTFQSGRYRWGRDITAATILLLAGLAIYGRMSPAARESGGV
jgi:hypothetical protein